MSTVQNPFENYSTPTGGESGISQANNPTAGIQPVTQTEAFTSNVDKPTETVQGQLDSILAKDSPLMQRARTLATQQMGQRGLVNSSMAVGAGTSAMIDAATPIAAQDANTYGQRNMFNTDIRNQNAQFNTNQTNDLYKFGQDVAARFGLQQGQQNFEAGQRQLDRQFQTSERLGGEQFAAQQLATQQNFQQRMMELEQQGMDFRQAREIASKEMLAQLDMAGVQNRFDRELALRAEMFNVEQYNMERRQILDNQAQLERLGLQINANNQNIPTSFAASVSNTTMAGINAIMADDQLTAAAKQTAIDNVIKYANAQISWAEKFYNVAIPRLPGISV